ncbi:hypothetical protein [Pseudomonas sp. GM25]|uniref:hypothetical protein n=1 Tax=Pseudomonas sp. GM25 TaxID=1144327 RepID=UPI0002704FCF|nr:hypothetical protein [Pseudomonas sp. GM25]EJM25758.1 hypothetical protein PMI24_04106 [Pseudomonas sp. GM25]
MPQRIVALAPSADEIGDSLFFNPSLFGELDKLNRINPHTVSVMLILVAEIGDAGAVTVSQTAVAHRCEIGLQDVEKAIADLEAAGLISSVKISKEPGGTIACVVNPDLAQAEKPDERGSL